MQAVVYYRYGSPDALECRDIEKPEPGSGEILIRVQAAAVNPYDWHFLRGTPVFIRLLTGLRNPKSPRLGADCAGIVEAIGRGVERLKAGDNVFGVCKGSFAEFACGKESELSLVPPNVTFAQAASLPIAGITALQGLRDCGQLKAGQAVLVNGAAGGVGTFAVQIATALGATVTAVCSTRNREMVEALGAHQVIDYNREDFTTTPGAFDVIFDLVGNRSLSAIRQALKPNGIFVGCGGGGPDEPSGKLLGSMLGRALIAPFSRQRLTGVLAKVNTADLDVLSSMLASGEIKPVLDRAYPLRDTADAFRYVEGCHARGKVIIAVA